MNFTITATVDTDVIYDEAQAKLIHEQITAEILHALTSGSRHGASSLNIGSRVVMCLSYDDPFHGVTSYFPSTFTLLPRSEWKAEASDWGSSSSNSDIEDALDSRNVVNAEAVPAQLELFKSVRRKPTVTEMMTEVVQFCNRG